MFSSFNCVNSLESLLKDHTSDQNPSSKQDHDPPFLFNFPSPFLDEHESPLSQIFSQNQEMAGSDLHQSDQTKQPKKANIGTSKLVEKEADQENPSRTTTPLRRRNLGVVPRRRTGKKDRHSKICTAQGIRDRRMRLSLQVARKFFDLQDMLGYDKASKTIEWLFTKSKKAINELILHHYQANNVSLSDAKSESFLSECEVVSRIGEKTSNKDFMEGVPLTSRASKSSMRESREKARARARCRTREKMMVKQNPSDNGHVQKLGFSTNPFEGVDQELKFKSQERVSPYEASSNSLGYPLVDVNTIEDFLGNSMLPPVQAVSAPIGCAIFGSCSGAFSDANCNFLGFFGNMDLVNNERGSSIYSITNEDSMEGKPNSVYEEFP